MPKFSCEIDSDAKTTKFMIDGNEVPAYDFSIGCYTGHKCCDPEDESKVQARKECYVSVSQGDINDRYTHSVNFSLDSDNFYSESITRYHAVAKEIGKIISKVIAATKLHN